MKKIFYSFIFCIIFNSFAFADPLIYNVSNFNIPIEQPTDLIGNFYTWNNILFVPANHKSGPYGNNNYGAYLLYQYQSKWYIIDNLPSLSLIMTIAASPENDGIILRCVDDNANVVILKLKLQIIN